MMELGSGWGDRMLDEFQMIEVCTAASRRWKRIRITKGLSYWKVKLFKSMNVL